MQYTNLGKTGLKVSRLCLGMMTYGSKQWREWMLDEEQAKPFVKRALDAGINFFDTADVYSLGESEKITGNVLRHFGVKRENVIVATKVFSTMSEDVNDRGLSRKHIMDSIDKSLKRLQMEYVDLYQIHRWDYNTPIEETMEALNDVVRAGKARYIGASSMFAWQFMKALHVSEMNGWSKFVSMQNHYNLVYREEEREMIPLCKDQGIGLIPWSPMARGFFAGNRKRGGGGETTRAQSDPFANELYFREEDFVIAERAAEVAKSHNASASQVALAWVLNKPHIAAPIIGSSKIEHLDQAIAALEIKLTADEIQLLEELYQPHPILGHA
ncbi:MAG TPA: aldo/keto reductase [Anaerolineales bacterium]|nr:aldo/keto reductase [Anaerolineales bacterium]HND91925.1 aldo/keto reductase [Anaerolineales bacterium]HNH78491.1 aldo/keto reductase [Anaerolineales bacterium]HNO83442.1 aldo/keto reductase [Anaerolineales bacterium]HUM25059.1 aldo/keto reductase [Anaerolineales bacterium]